VPLDYLFYLRFETGSSGWWLYLPLQLCDSLISSCYSGFKSLDLWLSADVTKRSSSDRFTSRSSLDPPSPAGFSFDFVVTSPFPSWCTCTFSTADVASGSLVDMIIIYEVLFIVCCDEPLSEITRVNWVYIPWESKYKLTWKSCSSSSTYITHYRYEG
jgi:hypothetical protein